MSRVDTQHLIANLAAGAAPVRPLRPPLLRALLWLAAALGLVAGLALLRGPRPDLAEQLGSSTFLPMLVAALATAVLAAVAAFQLSLPDRSRWWGLLPVPSAVLWLSTIGYGCLFSWVEIGQGDVSLARALDCLLTLLLVGLPISGGLAMMVRHAALLDASTVAALGALGSAALTAVALSLLHPLDATAMVLIWHVGLAVLACTLAHRFGRRLLAVAASGAP